MVFQTSVNDRIIHSGPQGKTFGKIHDLFLSCFTQIQAYGLYLSNIFQIWSLLIPSTATTLAWATIIFHPPNLQKLPNHSPIFYSWPSCKSNFYILIRTIMLKQEAFQFLWHTRFSHNKPLEHYFLCLKYYLLLLAAILPLDLSYTAIEKYSLNLWDYIIYGNIVLN